MPKRTFWIYKIAGDERYSLSTIRMVPEARPVLLTTNEYLRINQFWDYHGIQRWLERQYQTAGE